MRAAIIDTPWSAAFISYVIRQSGVGAERVQVLQCPSRLYLRRFRGERGRADNKARRAASIAPVRSPRPGLASGDMICQQREPALADASEEAVRERIREELERRRRRALGPAHPLRGGRRMSMQRARKMYTIGGNVNQAVTARKLNLRRDLKFSAVAKGPLRRPRPLDPAAARGRTRRRRATARNARSTTRNGSCCCS